MKPITMTGENPPQDPADRCEDYRLVLAHLSSYLGAGFGDENTTADQYDEKIRWGIKENVRRLTQYCDELRAKLAKYTDPSPVTMESVMPFHPTIIDDHTVSWTSKTAGPIASLRLDFEMGCDGATITDKTAEVGFPFPDTVAQLHGLLVGLGMIRPQTEDEFAGCV